MLLHLNKNKFCLFSNRLVYKEILKNSSPIKSDNEDDSLIMRLAQAPDLIDTIPDGDPKLDQAINLFETKINQGDRKLQRLNTQKFQLTNEIFETSEAPDLSTAERKPQEFNPIQGINTGLIYAKNLPQSITMSEFEAILVPSHCKVTHEDTYSLFEFHNGGYIKVESNTDSTIKTINLLYKNYGISPEKIAKNLINAIDQAKKQNLFINQNPYYKEEKTVQKRIEEKKIGDLFSSVLPAEIEKGFNNDILIIPDLHGDNMRHELTKSLIEKGNIDWFAIEMLPHTMQKTIDLFINSPEESDEYKKSRKELINYYSKNWNNKHEDIKSPEENPYFLLLESCKTHEVQVRAMDVTGKYYRSNNLTDKLIVGTRNLVWANQIPNKGKGVIFGGLAHFQWNSGIRVQDFLSDERKKEVSVVSFKK